MFDKDLLKLLGKNKKYLFVAVIFMILKALGNLGLTASVCYALAVAFEGLEPMHYLYATLSFLGCLALRYIFGRLSDESKDAIGRQAKKELRLRAYSKIVALGGGEGSGMGLSGLSQISLEGIEQLDLYYSTYLPQFFYSMIFPFILFAILAPLEWHAALVLLCCVPLIPVYSRFHHRGQQVCQKGLCQILGPIHFHGRRLPGRHPRIEGSIRL